MDSIAAGGVVSMRRRGGGAGEGALWCPEGSRSRINITVEREGGVRLTYNLAVYTARRFMIMYHEIHCAVYVMVTLYCTVRYMNRIKL